MLNLPIHQIKQCHEGIGKPKGYDKELLVTIPSSEGGHRVIHIPKPKLIITWPKINF